ncbi:hypothetical protein PLICRDRAFT_647460 [Plicaturopsis crispa FD-325 SS-3]|nr:hypothetical protein PLICRDRAFT_647460 [Plicaturopsis crispa FD-325 SS-3]
MAHAYCLSLSKMCLRLGARALALPHLCLTRLEAIAALRTHQTQKARPTMINVIRFRLFPAWQSVAVHPGLTQLVAIVGIHGRSIRSCTP